MKSRSIVVVISVVTALVAIGAAKKETRTPVSATAPVTIDLKQTAPQMAPTVKTETETALPEIPTAAAAADPAAFQMTWYSINGGGAINASSTNYQMGLSVGQSVAGAASGTNYDMGIGFWYGAAAGGACPMVVYGDLNNSGTVTSADIIVLVNYVFKGGPAPVPCAAAGDVNCNATVTSSDIIVLVNFVFKGGAAPCNTCTSPLAAGC